MSIIQAIIGSSVVENPTITNVYYSNTIHEGDGVGIIIDYSNFSGQSIYWEIEYGPGVSGGDFNGAGAGSFNLVGSGSYVLYVYPNTNIGNSWTFGIKLMTNEYALKVYYDTGSSAFVVVSPAPCFPAGTLISMSDGTKKAIEHITVDDDILVWDFDRGVYAEAKPIWIKVAETSPSYNVLTFSDGSVLKTVGHHHIFNKQAKRFTHTMTNDTPIGTVSINEHGKEITLVSATIVQEPVEFYNVWTSYHLNVFAQGVLTSNRFNNTYPMVGMKFVKDNRVLRSLEEFADIDPKYISGLRLQEQPKYHTSEYIKDYVHDRLERLDIATASMPEAVT